VVYHLGRLPLMRSRADTEAVLSQSFARDNNELAATLQD